MAYKIFIMQDDIIPQTKKDDDTAEAVIVHEEATKPFFAWPFGGQAAAPDGRKNEERETAQKVTATMESLMQTVRNSKAYIVIHL